MCVVLSKFTTLVDTKAANTEAANTEAANPKQKQPERFVEFFLIIDAILAIYKNIYIHE
jgi:hypothetical protein